MSADNDKSPKPRTAAEETEEEVRQALTHPGGEDEQHTGEAGDALRPNEEAQEQAYGEPDEPGR